MIVWRADVAGASLHHLTLAVPLFPIAHLALFQESKLPGRIHRAVLDPSTEEHVAAAHEETDVTGRVRDRCVDRRRTFRRAAFVGVEKQNPLVPRVPVIERPVALLAKIFKGVTEHTDLWKPVLQDFDGAVCAAGINNDDLGECAHAFHTRHDVHGLVVCEDHDRYGNRPARHVQLVKRPPVWSCGFLSSGQCSSSVRSSRSAARSTEKSALKQACAFRRQAFRSAADIVSQCESISRALSTLSRPTRPERVFSIIGQMLTLSVVRTGTPQPSASTTAMP